MLGFFIRNGAVLKKYIGLSKDVEVPSDAHTISCETFFLNKKIESVNIPNSITNIEASAFDCCYNLSHVDLPSSLTVIQRSTFSNCRSLEKIELPKNLKRIERMAFYNTSLKTIKIPEGVTEIGDRAFYTNDTLELAIIPNSVVSIGEDAFYGAENLMILTCENSEGERYAKRNGIQYIPAERILEQVDDDKNDKVIEDTDEDTDDIKENIAAPVYADDIFVIKDSKLVSCEKHPEYIRIPDGITVIGKQAFLNHSQLRKVIIPASVRTIEDEAFNNCTRLEIEELPEGIETVGEYAFRHCRSITSLRLPKSLKSLKWSAFMYCTELSKLVFEDSASEIEGHGFSSVPKLTSITLPKTIRIKNQAETMFPFFLGCSKELVVKCEPESDSYYSAKRVGASCELIGNKKPSITAGLIIKNNVVTGYTGESPEVIIPDGVSEIGVSAFEGNENICIVFIPNSVSIIGNNAFKYCDRLHTVHLSSNLRRIGNKAFYWCHNLERIDIPEGVTEIGENAFSCSDILDIHLPNSVIKIGDDAFDHCSALKGLRISDSVKSFGKILSDNCLTTIFAPQGSFAADYAMKNNIKLTYGDRIVKPKVHSVKKATDLYGNIGRLYYETLKNEQKKAYEIILNALFNMEPNCDLSNIRITTWDLLQVKSAIEYDYPQIFWVDWNQSFRAETLNKMYCITKLQKEKMQKQIDDVVDPFIASIPKNLGEYEKAIKAHEWLANEIEYAHEELKIQESQSRPSISFDVLRNIYGAFINKRVVCVGYARAYQYLLQKLGVVSASCVSQMDLHEWSIARLEGNNYHIDVTNNDGLSTLFSNKCDEFNYFGLSDDEILRKVKGTGSAISYSIFCNSDKCNYYYKLGQYIDSYSEEEILRKIKQSYKNTDKQEIIFKFPHAGLLEKTKEIIADNGKTELLRRELDCLSIFTLQEDWADLTLKLQIF